MKIVATKKEFANIIRRCMNDCECAQCIFADYCGRSSGTFLEDFIEIEAEVQEDENIKSV